MCDESVVRAAVFIVEDERREEVHESNDDDVAIPCLINLFKFLIFFVCLLK